MKIIGITGPTGSGKSILGKFLSENGVVYVDADNVYHSLLLPPSECLNAIKLSFGDQVFSPDGKLSRPALAKVVFNSPEKLELLNKTVLKHVVSAIREIVRENKRKGTQILAVDAPTLIESGFNKDCDFVISVIASQDIRVERIRERDSLSKEAALLRVKAQKSNDFYIENSDFSIENNGDIKAFYSNAKKIFDKINS